jgi:hypothetical protein
MKTQKTTRKAWHDLDFLAVSGVQVVEDVNEEVAQHVEHFVVVLIQAHFQIWKGGIGG